MCTHFIVVRTEGGSGEGRGGGKYILLLGIRAWLYPSVSIFALSLHEMWLAYRLAS